MLEVLMKAHELGNQVTCCAFGSCFMFYVVTLSWQHELVYIYILYYILKMNVYIYIYVISN